MALKNSKTGSLPVSEIYSFMKEHFPYFKVKGPSPGWGGWSFSGLPWHCQNPGLVPGQTEPPFRPPVMSIGACLCTLTQTWAKKSRKGRGHLSWALMEEEELIRHPKGQRVEGQPSKT